MIPGLAGGVGGSTVGIGQDFAKARLLLAKRAGYMPNNAPINTQNPSQQWKSVSANLAKDSSQAGFQNPMQYLREGALTGNLPKGRTRPGGPGATTPLAYANSLTANQGAMAPLPQTGPIPAAPVATQPGVGGRTQAAELGARIAALRASLVPQVPMQLGRGGVT